MYCIWNKSSYYIRIFALLLTIFLLSVSILYCIGQITELSVSNYWCKRRELIEIHQHSIENNLPQGTEKGCWSSKDFNVDQVALFSSSSFSSFRSLSTINILRGTLFAITAIWFFVIFSWFFIKFICDIYRLQHPFKYFDDENMNNNNNQTDKVKDSKFQICCPCFSCIRCDCKCMNKMADLVLKYITWYSMIFGVDTGWYITMYMFRECCEIILQIQALLYYNGYDVMGTFGEDKQVILAHNPQLILLFAIILSLNCVFVGILWICYAIKPKTCHGYMYKQELAILDTIFDTFYAMFPLIIVLNEQENNKSIAVAIGALQTKHIINFMSAYIPMLFLSRKCWSMLWYSQKLMRKELKDYYSEIKLPAYLAERVGSVTYVSEEADDHRIHDIVSIPNSPQLSSIQYPPSMSRQSSESQCIPNSIQLTDWNHSDSPKSFDNVQTRATSVSAVAINQIENKQKQIKEEMEKNNKKYIAANMINKKHQNIVIGFGTIYVILGVIVLFVFTYIMIKAQNKCSNWNNDKNILSHHPELYLWDYCEYKVYPAFNSINDIPCNCRLFRMDLNDKNIEDIYNITQIHTINNKTLSDSIEHIFLHWTMLEKFSLTLPRNEYKKYPPLKFNNSNMYGATNLRVVQFAEIRIEGFNEMLGEKWSDLEFFSVSHVALKSLPSSFSNLHKLQYVELDENELVAFPTQICKLQNVQYLSIQVNKFENIPDCILDLEGSLQSFFISGTPINSFNIKLFNMRNLQQIAAQATAITLESFKESGNNVLQFEYNSPQKTFVSLQGTPFCSTYNVYGYPNDSIIEDFVDETDSCFKYCSVYFRMIDCQVDKWQDGICDEECNNVECQFDGGDCNQLCEWDMDNNCTLKSFGNRQCNPSCNTTHCGYDGGDCITFDTLECNDTLCRPEWLGDGWCDSVCDNLQCNWDHQDCNECTSNCKSAIDTFNWIANAIIDDGIMDKDELCDYGWFLIAAQSFAQKYDDCQQGFVDFDANHDGYISAYEVTLLDIFVSFTQLDLDKSMQVDCSKCSDPETYFYGYPQMQ